MKPDAPQKAVNDKDGPEPVAERLGIPMWLVVLSGLLVYWGSLFVAENAGGFAEVVYPPYNSPEEVAQFNPPTTGGEALAMGRKVYDTTCTACHQANGLGKEGTAPPLDGSEWVLAAGGDRIARIVLNGLTGPVTVKNQTFNLTMPPWRDNFTDAQLAAVLTYVRQNWDNKAGPIKPELLKAARAEKHPGPETSAELQKIPLQ